VDVDIEDELQDHLPARIVERLRTLGLDTVQLEAVPTNENARAIYARWGFKEQELTLATPVDELAQHLVQSR
jgi:ribosomal protein S18 acetylase RimI-like enzyme